MDTSVHTHKQTHKIHACKKKKKKKIKESNKITQMKICHVIGIFSNTNAWIKKKNNFIKKVSTI